MRIFSVRLAAALLLSLSLAACQASGTAGRSRGANASVFTNILTLQSINRSGFIRLKSPTAISFKPFLV